VVGGWPGVEAGPGDRGEFSFRFRGREIGHLHGDRAAHFGFPADLGAELRKAGRVGPHPVSPQSVKLAARRIQSAADVGEVVELMRLSYERLVERLDQPDPAGGAPGDSPGRDGVETPEPRTTS
jgi:hypothetical protein